jgi:hypothetical protein
MQTFGQSQIRRAKRDNDKEGIRSTKYNSSSNMPDGGAVPDQPGLRI